MNIPLTPLRCLRYAQQQYPQRTAVVCGDLRFTYAQFADRAARLAGALRAAGVKPGDRVAFLSMNCHRLLEAYYGVLDAGAILLPLNIRLAPHELAFILNDAGAKVLFLEKDFLGAVDSFRHTVPTVEAFYMLDSTASADWLAPKSYDELVAHASHYQTDIMDVDENAVAELFYTSGTSATPKGVMLTHRNIYMHALYACLTDDPTAEAVQLHTIPLFHANGWGTPHALALTGGKHVMLQRFETKRIFQLIQQERVRNMCLVPAMATALVNCPERPKHDLSSLRIINIGGAASSPTLVREVEEKLGASCRSGYGLTETSPTLSVSRMKPGLNWEGEQKFAGQAMTGFAMAGVELRVVDSNDNDVLHDGVSIGEIVARSDVVMEGYWGQPQATAEAMRGGWFHTGDMATINEDGYLLVVDRKKEIIVSGGENISSLEVEKALLAHPGVYEVAVVAVPDEKWGEVPKALVVLKPGAQLTEAELIEFCRARISHYKCPRSVEFFASLPKTGTGKILKRELRKKYWGGQDTIRPEFATRKSGSS
ncbi:MAG TPA: long-chain-fatty-acid--CoA ligase [Candidatus Acidoferrum sp.]|nr:long-chain-fatty-acid--CoA ligase [Candidatus Acidoferrum sp.]